MKPEFKELEQELQEVDRILKMTDHDEKKKYYPKMKELLSKISSYYENQKIQKILHKKLWLAFSEMVDLFFNILYLPFWLSS